MGQHRLKEETKAGDSDLRSLVDQDEVSDDTVRAIQDVAAKVYGKIPELFRVKGLVDDPEWYETFFEVAMQWPPSCGLDEKTRHFMGLAKSLAYLWKPGILAHLEFCRRAGASQGEVSEVIKVAAVCLGLGNLEVALAALDDAVTNERHLLSADRIEDERTLEIVEDAKRLMGETPPVYLSRYIVEDPYWLELLHDAVSVLFNPGALDAKTKHLLCVAVSSISRWQGGVRRHARLALDSGATRREVADVIKSSFKTGLSVGTQAGYSTPCFVPPESAGGCGEE